MDDPKPVQKNAGTGKLLAFAPRERKNMRPWEPNGGFVQFAKKDPSAEKPGKKEETSKCMTVPELREIAENGQTSEERFEALRKLSKWPNHIRDVAIIKGSETGLEAVRLLEAYWTGAIEGAENGQMKGLAEYRCTQCFSSLLENTFHEDVRVAVRDVLARLRRQELHGI